MNIVPANALSFSFSTFFSSIGFAISSLNKKISFVASYVFSPKASTSHASTYPEEDELNVHLAELQKAVKAGKLDVVETVIQKNEDLLSCKRGSIRDLIPDAIKTEKQDIANFPIKKLGLSVREVSLLINNAVITGKKNLAEVLLNYPVDNLLDASFSLNHLDCVKYLLENHSFSDITKSTYLANAVKTGKLDIVKLLLKDTKLTEFRTIEILERCNLKNLAMLDYLLKTVIFSTENKTMVLHDAIHEPNFKAIDVFVQNANEAHLEGNFTRTSILAEAIKRRSLPVVKYLLCKNFDFSAPESINTLLKTLNELRLNLITLNDTNIDNQLLELLECLLKYSPESRKTYLWNGSSENYTKIVQLLIKTYEDSKKGRIYNKLKSATNCLIEKGIISKNHFAHRKLKAFRQYFRPHGKISRKETTLQMSR